MAYTLIPESAINVGKAIKRELLTSIRDSLIDHEARISALALGAAPVEVFNAPILNASSATSLTGIMYYRALTNFTLSTVQVEIFEKGIVTSGTLAIDVKKGPSLDGAGMSTVLTSLPSINFATATDYDIATGVLDSVGQVVSQGDVLRVDVTSLPALPLGKFRVLVYGEI